MNIADRGLPVLTPNVPAAERFTDKENLPASIIRTPKAP